MTWIKWLGWTVLLIALAWAALAALGSSRRDEAMRVLEPQLEASRHTDEGAGGTSLAKL